MADFKLAFQKVKESQGLYPYYSDVNRTDGELILCSDCFTDEGLSLDASKIGLENDTKCPNCSSENGKKLTRQIVRELCYRFFVRGTIERFNYGGFPLIHMNEERFGNSEINVSPWLDKDVKLIEKAGEIGLFYYSPRFWMFGENDPLENLHDKRKFVSVVQRILELYPKHILTNEHPFYRIRINPKSPHEVSEYDSPPKRSRTRNRFNAKDNSIMYASPDIELCIHECRSSIEDDLYVAKLIPQKPLKMLNLAALIEETDVTEFTSVDMAIHFLFLAGSHSYPICSKIAKYIENEGFDGIIYPSYFSYIRTGAVPFETILGMSIRRLAPLKEYAESQSALNVALFGWPIKEGKVNVHSINRVLINTIKYDLSFGPAYQEGLVDKSKKAEFLGKKIKAEFEKLQNAFREQ